jgi:predicted transposase YbfD/YdcC
MPKNDNAHALRMQESLKKADTEIANDFTENFPLSKNADIEKKFQWAKDVCNYLEDNFDKEDIIKVRKECRCNDGASIANKLLKYLNNAKNIKEFVDSLNQNETFAFIEYVSDKKIIFCYPECYCACVKRIPQLLSKTWCYCTLGNAECIFKSVFVSDVNVLLIESIKSGGDKCAIEVEW